MKTDRESWEAWVKRCSDVLHGNQMTSSGYRYTRPAPHVYEHQWLWDSCFHAITYRWFDPQMAQDELLSLLHHQLQDGPDAGMVPHMAYWTGGGTELWGADQHSIITQPPLIATAALKVYETTQDMAFLEAVYRPIANYHNWFDRRRVLDGDRLAILIHPWESGWDASPRWDTAMGLSRPTDDQSKNARHALAGRLRDEGCHPEKLRASGAFSAKPVDFNAIRAADLEALAKIAEALGVDPLPHSVRAWSLQQSVRERLYQSGFGVDRFGMGNIAGTHESAAQFVLLFGGCLDDTQAESLVKRLQSNAYSPQFPIPTTPTDAPDYDGGHYWRGNVWLAVNWLIYTGLRRYGYHALARDLATRSLKLVEQYGFHEYFHPQDGTGYGPSQQSWSTIVLDMLGTERNT
jgi:glycogen debranching enzyme